MSINYATINQKQEKIIKNFNDAELKTYINNLVRNYYLAVFDDDNKKVKSIIENINLVKSLSSNNNIDDFINFAFIRCFNKLVIENIQTGFEIKEINLLEPSLNIKNSNMNYTPETTLQKIIRHKRDMQACSIAENWEHEYTIKELKYKIFNFEKYRIKDNE